MEWWLSMNFSSSEYRAFWASYKLIFVQESAVDSGSKRY